jgi:hypothetical protein
MMAAAASGPWYAIVYLATSPLVAGISRAGLAQGSLIQASWGFILPVSLIIGYLAPAILMALHSPSFVSNDFQQVAVVAWNIFPILVGLVHVTLNRASALLGFSVKEPSSPSQHLRAVRFANICGLTISTISHIAMVTLSTMTVMFPFIFQPDYVRELSPRALMAPPFFSIISSSFGEGVRSFLLWDQICANTTMIVLALLQLREVISVSRDSLTPLSSFALFTVGTIVAGPGSACLALNWLRDELLFGGPVVTKSGSDAAKERLK